MVEETKSYPNSFSKPKYIRKPCLFNTLLYIKSLQTAGRREKFNSLHVALYLAVASLRDKPSVCFPFAVQAVIPKQRADVGSIPIRRSLVITRKPESESGHVTKNVVNLSQTLSRICRKHSDQFILLMMGCSFTANQLLVQHSFEIALQTTPVHIGA